MHLSQNVLWPCSFQCHLGSSSALTWYKGTYYQCHCSCLQAECRGPWTSCFFPFLEHLSFLYIGPVILLLTWDCGSRNFKTLKLQIASIFCQVSRTSEISHIRPPDILLSMIFFLFSLTWDRVGGKSSNSYKPCWNYFKNLLNFHLRSTHKSTAFVFLYFANLRVYDCIFILP